MIKKYIFSIFTLFSLTLNAESKYSEFLDKQIALTYAMSDVNLTQKSIIQDVKIQQGMYEEELYKLMSNKSDFLAKMKDHTSDIFALKKVIAINKRAGNTYAVLRDEVQVKSYQLVSLEQSLIRNVLLALDLPSIEEYEKKINTLTSQTQSDIAKLQKVDYKPYLKLDDNNSRVKKKLKENIREFYALQEINSDLIGFIYNFESEMYRLNKYSKYHIIKIVVYLQSIPIVKEIDDTLESYGLSIIKLLIIVSMTLLTYLFRTIVYVSIQRSFAKIEFLARYSEMILSKLKGTISSLVLVINANIILYIYNDFSNLEVFAKLFNMIYAIYFTVIIYIFANTLASIKIMSMNLASTQVKSELINVGIKIINFLIILIGFLLALFFAGVDLTTVLSGLGIGGFAVAFAAKDTISNFFGTLSVLFSDAFSQGDWIEIDGHEGVVVEIGLRVTTLRTFDNALIAIPNGTFAAKEIKNWNKRKLGRRIKMSLGVKYDSKKEDISNAVKEIREMLKSHPDIASEHTKYDYSDSSHSVKLVLKEDLQGIKKTLLVYLDEFDSSSINILVYCFSKSVNWEDWLATKQDVMEKIMDIFEKNSLEFAFPSLSIYDETAKDLKH